MEKYRSLHLWMLLPLIIMQLGIYMDYWGDFTDNSWGVHVHYWSGTIWYIYLIIQPYFATHGQMAKHRTNGIIGMFLAGGVSLTAFAMLERDIRTIERAAELPDRFGPFEPWFFYGVVIVEIVMMAAFTYAIIQGILKRKKLEDHAWWLTSTVFLIMMPALGRGIQNVYIGMNAESWPNIDIIFPLYICQGVIILLLLLSAWKFKKLKHPATILALGVNIFVMFLPQFGKSETLQHLVDTFIKA